MLPILFSGKMLTGWNLNIPRDFNVQMGKNLMSLKMETKTQQPLFDSPVACLDDTSTSYAAAFLLLQPGTSGALQTPRSSQKACTPLLWCSVFRASPTSCRPTRALAHCRSLWGAQSKISSNSWSSSSWCLWPSWLACSTCTHTTLEPSTILPSPRESCLAVRVANMCDWMVVLSTCIYMSFQKGQW